MRLNGWQRLWVVGVALWSLAVGAGAWWNWPRPERDYLSVFAGAGDGIGTIGYYDAAAHLAKWSDSALAELPDGSWPSLVPEPLPSISEVVAEDLVMVPTIGKVRLPATMSEAQANAAIKALYDKHEALLIKVNLEKRRRFDAAKLHVVRMAIAAGLLPPLLVFAFGWAAVWVRRGFRSVPT